MSTIYREFQNDGFHDGFSSLLQEAAEYFKTEHRMNIIGDGIKNVLTDSNAFADYVKKFTEGVDPTEKKQLEQLFKNARVTTLTEAVSGIQAHASLTMPVIRKMWARIALKYAVPTEPVKVPAFSVAFTSPYVLQPDGKKVPLPDAINSVEADALRPVSNTRVLREEYDADGLKKVILPENAATLDPIHHHLDKSSVLKDIKIELEGVECVKVLDLKADLYGRLYKEFNIIPQGSVDEYKITLMGSFDFESPHVMLFCNVIKLSDGSVVADPGLKYFVDGFFTHETHNESVNVAIDIFKRDIEIGTGTHIENSLQLEFLQDAMAMYSIDGAAETIDVMSNVIAQKVDIEIYQFLANSAQRMKATGVKNKTLFEGKFCIKPSIGFNGSPKEWREELKTIIDHFAIRMKSNKFFYQGYFVIIGNPVDTALIPNVNWSFNKITDDQNGVEVEYSIGAMSGSQRYTVVASDLIPDGELLMFFVPTTNKYITYKYYPYTFNVVHDYRNALISNVPSVMIH